MFILNVLEKHIDCFNSFEVIDCEMFAYKNCMRIENELFVKMYIVYCIFL